MANLASIKLIVFDVDGVLTDGSIIVNDQGIESKRFHVRDGFALKAAMQSGLKVGILTGRSTRAVALRMVELGIDLVAQGVSDKRVGLEQLCQQAGVQTDEAAYVGDDLIDLPAMMLCGYSIAVADAVAEVREQADHTTHTCGGRGAVREAVEHILKAQNKWDAVVDRYL